MNPGSDEETAAANMQLRATKYSMQDTFCTKETDDNYQSEKRKYRLNKLIISMVMPEIT